jgi:hypothetical protein
MGPVGRGVVRRPYFVVSLSLIVQLEDHVDYHEPPKGQPKHDTTMDVNEKAFKQKSRALQSQLNVRDAHGLYPLHVPEIWSKPLFSSSSSADEQTFNSSTQIKLHPKSNG